MKNAANKTYDLIVAGGGLAGVAAALASAREGKKVLLIERYGYLGGMATAGLVNPFMPYWLWTGNWQCDMKSPVNQGIFQTLLGKLDPLGGLHENRQTFSEEILKLILDRWLAQRGVNVLLHSTISKVNQKDGRIASVEALSKAGLRRYHASCFVDATGDADLAAMAKAPVRVGRDADGQCQPMTLCFRVSGVDRQKFDIERDKESINAKYRSLQAQGSIHNPREDVLIFEHMQDGVFHFNSTRVTGQSALDPESLSLAEREAREQAYELVEFMKNHVAGFEKAQLLMSAAHVGVRESRRIVGDYTLQQDDMLSARKFPDSICRGTYPVDIHDPKGSGTTLKNIPYGDYYTIPYRALLPQGLSNLIVAGRPISSSHEAHSAHRIMPICCNVGEAAGIAAALATSEGFDFRRVEVETLQASLRRHGGLV